MSDHVQKYVYFAIARDMVKIGCSVKPAHRLTQVAEWVPYKMTLAATMPGGIDLETALHKQFIDDWSHLEWFHLTPRLSAFIARVAAGLPVEITPNPEAYASVRNAGLRAKKTLTARIHRAEILAHGRMYYSLLALRRPAYAQAVLDSYAGSHSPPPTPEAVAIAEQYIAALALEPPAIAA